MKELESISDKLDYSVQFSIKVSQKMNLMFAHLEGSVPLYASITENNGCQLSIYLDRLHDEKLDRIFGTAVQPPEGEFVIYELEADELVPEIQMLRKISNVPSVVPGGLYLENGQVFADFRFHHSALDKMSQVIKEVLKAHNNLKLSYLRHSKGLLNTLEDVNSRIPLSVLTFTFVPDSNYTPPQDLKTGPVAEVKMFSEGLDPEYDLVHYSKSLEPQDSSALITKGIFEAKFRTNFMKTFIKRIRDDKVPMVSLFGVYLEDHIDNFVFVPTFLSDNVLCMLNETSDNLRNDSVRLNSFVPFNSYN